MPKYVTLEKPVGETPLATLERYRIEHEVPRDIPLTYAGRLDPMASGKLLILCGEECKNRRAYDALDKEYEFEVLFGYATDTGDVLGMPRAVPETHRYSRKKLDSIARSLIGVHRVPYPAFSSKTVSGIPLFEYALKNTLHSIEIPKVDMRIYRVTCERIRITTGDVLRERILNKIILLQSNEFRSEEIGQKWSDLLSRSDTQYAIATFRAVVGSGTYIRTLASLIAERAGTDGIAYSIHRTKIGKFRMFGGLLGWWSRSF